MDAQSRVLLADIVEAGNLSLAARLLIDFVIGKAKAWSGQVNV